MTSVAALSTIVFSLVVSTSVQSQRAHQPPQFQSILQAGARGHDQKEFGGRGDEDARGLQLSPTWHVWARHGRLSHSDKETLRVRTRLLQDKLRLTQQRPAPQQTRVKREEPKYNTIWNTKYVWVAPKLRQGPEKKWKSDENAPPSIEAHFYNPDIFFPENIAALENDTGPYQDILRKERKKRPKRQAVFGGLEFQRVRRTTPNPFIPDTNLEDYRIGSADSAEQYVPDTDSCVMSEEASEFSKIISDFYLTTSSEFWPDIQQFAENVLKPLSRVLPIGTNRRKQTHGLDILSWTWEGTKHRVKRGVNKTLKRKRAKKRAQKKRRMDRKRLRMLTHAKRVRKQQKRRRERLERHYARMNMTQNMTMPWHPGYNASRVLVRSRSRGNASGSENIRPENIEVETAEMDSSSEYEEGSGDADSYEDDDSSGSEEDDTYEDYEESNSDCEDIEYENVTVRPSNPGKNNEKEIKPKRNQKNNDDPVTKSRT